MLKSIALRRVLIYFALSSAGVAVVSQLDLDQRSAGVIYVPMFVGIYVLSRWIEAKLSGPPATTATAAAEPPSKGFMAKSSKP
ncbi:hypothetical protein MY494_10320 [Synechococcus sp. A10-1-5-1]|uniref:hypothetical protein n=1 Tax=Synechococcus sp. A10-1-5-1 TaxID=2936507 RepID=UPI00200064B7|nr:hypothetical protein [Synechococcus sp. A10-1-5-1]UPM49715.1 hypothetical protein MY494_10320 [Synechococcus sp. A10-1-5-1]